MKNFRQKDKSIFNRNSSVTNKEAIDQVFLLDGLNYDRIKNLRAFIRWKLTYLNTPFLLYSMFPLHFTDAAGFFMLHFSMNFCLLLLSRIINCRHNNKRGWVLYEFDHALCLSIKIFSSEVYL